MARPNPTSFHDYDFGTSSSPRSSIGGQNEEQLSSSIGSNYLGLPDEEEHGLRRRRSSIVQRINAFTHAGGVNSIERFGQSLTRASAFHEIRPRVPSFRLADDGAADPENDDLEYGSVRTENGRFPRASIIGQNQDLPSPENAIDDESVHGTPPRLIHHKKSDRDRIIVGSLQGSIGGRSIFAVAPHLATPLAGSYGNSYGTLRSNVSESSMVHAGQLWKQQQASGANVADGEHMPLIVKEVEQDGKVVYVVQGQSTLPQTILNCTNVLIGVGLLSLSMGLKYSGLLCGMIFLALSAAVTAYTAGLLAKCMDSDGSLLSFSDLAFVTYGPGMRLVTSMLFTGELLTACVALVVLFADTLHTLYPSVGVVQWKIICGVLLIPLNFAPLRYLSYTSVVGIISCSMIVLIILTDGFLKPHSPGSLLEPAKQYIFPANWLTLPLSFGLLMSPWGGHSVFPNIYKDMRHPQKFPKAIKYTFGFTYFIDASTALIGILMFGDGVMDEITANILASSAYPRTLSIMISIFIAIIPLTKLPLNSRPIVSLVESYFGLESHAIADSPALTGLSSYTRGFMKVAIRILFIVLVVVIAIIFPAFDSIMAFMGSALCFTICVILPLLFYLKMFGKEISTRERIIDYFLVGISTVMAVTGTIWAFLPKELIGAN